MRRTIMKKSNLVQKEKEEEEEEKAVSAHDSYDEDDQKMPAVATINETAFGGGGRGGGAAAAASETGTASWDLFGGPSPRTLFLLKSLPEDQIRHVLSFLFLTDLLQLSLVSTDMARLVSMSHCVYMSIDDDDDDDDNDDGGQTEEAGVDTSGGAVGGSAFASSVAAAVQQHRHHQQQQQQQPEQQNLGPSVNGVNDRLLLFRSQQGLLQHPVPFMQPQNHDATIDGSNFTSQTNHSKTGRQRRRRMSEQRLISILRRFPDVRTLRLSGLSDMGDSFLPILNRSDAAPNLVHLELHDCVMKPDRTANSSGNNNSSTATLTPHHYRCLDLNGNEDKLTHIVLTGSPIFVPYTHALKSFTLCRNLQSVTLGGCRSLTDDDVTDMTTRLSGTLRELRLQHCSTLRQPTIQSSILHHLDLTGCVQLQDLTKIRCSDLQYFNASFCSSLVDTSIEYLVQTHRELQTLLLLQCNGLIHPRIVSMSLETINLGLCSNLRNTEIYCADLTRLEIGMCLSLKWMVLDSQRLIKLDLSMLPFEHLVLKTPELKELNLSGCFALTDKGMHGACPKLEMLDICGSDLTADAFHSENSTFACSSSSSTAETLFIKEGGQPPLKWHQTNNR